MKLNNLALVTYTHSNCKDVWPAYFKRLDQYALNITSYVFSNVTSNEYENHQLLTYDDDKSYCQEYVKCLEQVKEEYVIYMQEDFVVYSSVDKFLIESYLKRLIEDTNISYVRLLKCGDVTNINHSQNLYYVSPSGKTNNSINSFSMQPTIWKKHDLIKIYKLLTREKFGEGFDYAHAMNKLNINGVYHYAGEPSRGGHFDSFVFPYIATAIVKGKWNISEYPSELKQLFKENKINAQIRGFC